MGACRSRCLFFFFNDTATTEIYTLSLHDALPISSSRSSSLTTEPPCAIGSGLPADVLAQDPEPTDASDVHRSEEHTSELQSQSNLVCRLLLEKINSVVGLRRAV